MTEQRLAPGATPLHHPTFSSDTFSNILLHPDEIRLETNLRCAPLVAACYRVTGISDYQRVTKPHVG